MPKYKLQECDSIDEEEVALVDALGVSRMNMEKKVKKRKKRRNKLDQKSLYSFESQDSFSVNERKLIENDDCNKSRSKSFLSYADNDYVTSSDEEAELFRLKLQNFGHNNSEEGSNYNPSIKIPWLIQPLSSKEVSTHMTTRMNDGNSDLDYCSSVQSIQSSYQQSHEQEVSLGNRNISKYDITTFQDNESLLKESTVMNSDTETEDTFALGPLPSPAEKKKVKRRVTNEDEDDSYMETNYDRKERNMNKISMSSLVRAEKQIACMKKNRRSRTSTILYRIIIICWVPVFVLLTLGTYVLIRVLQGERMFDRPGRPRIDLRDFFNPSTFPRQNLNDTRASNILSRLSLIMGQPSLLTDKLAPQHHAALWLISNDKRNITTDDSSFLQRYALATFYYSTVMDKENHYRTWKKCGAAGKKQTQVCGYFSEVTPFSRFLSPVSECEWYGITCDPYGKVIRIKIHNNGLHGHIPSELSLIHSLTVISLSRNFISGAITTSIGKLRNLEVLDLSHNRLNGIIPIEIGNLPAIRSLNLGNNQLEGAIPSSTFVSTLETLDLGSNQLNGTVPETLYTIPNLEALDISFNSLTGTISPSLGTALDDVIMIRFHSNYLTGSLPEFWSKKDYMKEFNAGMNQFTGTIPSSIFRSPQMEYFDVGGNYLSGTISSNIHFMIHLRQLILWSNLFTGTIPSEISYLNHLQIFHIGLNKLSGSMPDAICTLRNESSLSDLTADCKNETNMICKCCTFCFDENYYK